MRQLLEDASHRLSDPPDQAHLSVVYEVQNGGPGRPRIDFDPNFLKFALELRGPSGIARFFDCSARTVRRKALQYGLLEPGDPPYHDVLLPGQPVRVWVGCRRHTRLSNISDESLDQEMANILRDAPTLGRRMIDGRLRSRQIHISRDRIAESYLRVHGPPPSFGSRCKIE
jgi:hypothetical protein